MSTALWIIGLSAAAGIANMLWLWLLDREIDK